MKKLIGWLTVACFLLSPFALAADSNSYNVIHVTQNPQDHSFTLAENNVSPGFIAENISDNLDKQFTTTQEPPKQYRKITTKACPSNNKVKSKTKKQEKVTTIRTIHQGLIAYAKLNKNGSYRSLTIARLNKRSHKRSLAMSKKHGHYKMAKLNKSHPHKTTLAMQKLNKNHAHKKALAMMSSKKHTAVKNKLALAKMHHRNTLAVAKAKKKEPHLKTVQAAV